MKVLGPAVLLAVAAILVPAGNASPAGSNVQVVAPSTCIFDGIDDVYTGNGHVAFGFALRNTGSSAATVTVTPVRHYSDGEYNDSAMDMLVDVKVPAYSTRRFRSPMYSYKAHAHAIVGAEDGMRLEGERGGTDGESGGGRFDEVTAFDRHDRHPREKRLA